MLFHTSEPVAASLRVWEREILQAGGWLAPDLMVMEDAGQLRCAVAGRRHQAGDLIVDYPPSVAVPLGALDWSDDPSVLSPVGGWDTLTPQQQWVLEAWVAMVSHLDRVESISRTHPAVALADGALRRALSAAGFPGVGLRPPPTAARRILLASHSEDAGDGTLRLIPIKNLVDHHPRGASQDPAPGRVAVAATAESGPTGTYESYGDLDALDQVMGYGYLDGAATVVHSVPVTVEVAGLGPIRVGDSAMRRGRRAAGSDLVWGGAPTGDRLDLTRVSFRAGGRGGVATMLAMALRAWGRSDSPASAADGVLDAIAAANLEYYGRVRALAEQASADGDSDPAVELVLAMCDVQTRRLRLWA